MSELKRLAIVTGYEFLKHVRRKRLYVILLLVLISEAAVLVGFPALMNGFPDDAKLMATMLSVGPSMAVIGAIFFSGDAIAGEFESKSGFMLFTNPVKRTTLVLGKYIASCIAVTILIIFGYLVLCISLCHISNNPIGDSTVFRFESSLRSYHCCFHFPLQFNFESAWGLR